VPITEFNCITPQEVLPHLNLVCPDNNSIAFHYAISFDSVHESFTVEQMRIQTESERINTDHVEFNPIYGDIHHVTLL
jgi:hypothetical protein